MLYDAGWAGAILATSALRNPGAGLTPVGFLDDDTELKGLRAADLPVFGGLDAMAWACRKTRASTLLITTPYAGGTELRRVVAQSVRLGLHVLTVPAIAQLPDGAIGVDKVRPLRIEDLYRSPARPPTADLRALVRQRPIMVIGAAGQIGAELARQLLALKPSRVDLVDYDEVRIRALADELGQIHDVAMGSTTVVSHVVDVTEPGAVSTLFQRTAPHAVLHAATRQAAAGVGDLSGEVRLNIGGTLALMDAAIACDVERLVMISTTGAEEDGVLDTAASLRVAEMLIVDAARRTGRQYRALRCGHLLDPDHAAIRAMRSTLTDDLTWDVTAAVPPMYPVGVSDAAQMALEAAASEPDGSVAGLPHGPRLRVGDVARDLALISGRDPDRMTIKVTGKAWPDEPAPVHVRGEARDLGTPLLMHQRRALTAPKELRAAADHLLDLAATGEHVRLRRELALLIRSADTADPASLEGNGYRRAVAVPIDSGEHRRLDEPASAPSDDGDETTTGTRTWRIPVMQGTRADQV